MRANKIVVKDLQKKFDTTRGSVLALDGVSFTVEQGEFVAILGPSGCGKTTLLRILGGLEEPTSGETRVLGSDEAGPLTSMVFQGNSVFPWMTVRDNVALLYWIAIEKVEGCMVATAMGQAALDEAVTYTKNRTVRGRPASDMQGIHFELADLYAKVEACRWMTYRTGMLHDTDDPRFQTEAAACKIFVQPVINDVIATALRLHGGYGYARDFKIERLYRAQVGNVVISVSLEINKAIVGASLVR